MIPYQTLQKRLKRDMLQCPAKLGRNSVFTPQKEKEMSEHLVKLANMFYGLTRHQFCRLAYKFAENQIIIHPFNKE